MVTLTGEHGLLGPLITDILQRGLQVEMTAHVAHRPEHADPAALENCRNGDRLKHVQTDFGTVDVRMPRDRDGTFDPVMVPRRGGSLGVPTARFAGLYASGATQTEIGSELDRLTRHQLAPDTSAALTRELGPVVRGWAARRFARSYSCLLFDTISLRSHDDHHLNVAVAVDGDGASELLGIWRQPPRAQRPGTSLRLLRDLRRRGVVNVESIFVGGDADLAAAAGGVWTEADVRPGVETLVLNAIREP